MRYGDETAASQVHKTWKWNQLGSRFEGKKSSNDDHRVRHSKRVSRENTTRRVKQWMRIAQPGESSSVDKKRPRSRTYRQLQQPLGYYDGSSVFSLPSPSTNERTRKERENRPTMPEAHQQEHQLVFWTLKLTRHRPTTCRSFVFRMLRNAVLKRNDDKTTSDWFKLLIRTEYNFLFPVVNEPNLLITTYEKLTTTSLLYSNPSHSFLFWEFISYCWFPLSL